MKKHLIIFTILFSALMLASPAHAEWTKLGESTRGNSYYVDFSKIRTQGNYIYYWRLTDYLESNSSAQVYYQTNCTVFRFKELSKVYYEQAMGEGAPDSRQIHKDPQWDYPPPNSLTETLLTKICQQ